MRNYKQMGALVLGGLTSGSALCFAGNTLPVDKPNLVLVFVDDMGWGTFAPNLSDITKEDLNKKFIYSHVKDYTPEEAFEAAQKAMPHLSRYCAEGVRFTDAYVTANVSSPSRAGMLTSSYQQRYGLYINPDADRGIPEDITLMPRVLQKNGYVNGIFGKYHNGKAMDKKFTCSPGHHPLDRGFDKFFGFNRHGTPYYDSKIIFNDRKNVKCKEYTTDRFTAEAIKFIDRHKGKPKLVYLPYNALHGPLTDLAPKKYQKRFNYQSLQLNKYAAYTAAIDDGVEAVMRKLEEIGEIDNTVLVFMSDNGAPGGAAATLPKNGPFSGFKGQNMQGGFRVPMFIWYGNKIKQGVVCDKMVSSMDVFPTFFDFAGIDLPKEQVVDGRSLAPILKGENVEEVHESLVWMSQQSESWGLWSGDDQATALASFMVRKGKYVLRYIIENNTFYLHDIETDRKEEVNLINNYPEIAEELKSAFKEWYKEMKPPVVWKKELWQNIRYWDISLPKPPKVVKEKKK